MHAQPTQHRSHEYRPLIQRWQALAKKAGLRMRVFGRSAGMPLYVVTSPGPKKDTREAIYISAGIHGDEPAPPWGLLAWAEAHTELLQTRRFILFPLLNPYGLMANTRVDRQGNDLNRIFDSEDHELITAWRKVVDGMRFSLGLCLHEDYDGQGCYLYELTTLKESLGAKLLQDTARVIPTDTRRSIDGRRATDGLVVRRRMPKIAGTPESFVLHSMGAPLSFTFESPSEFSLNERVAVQAVFIQSALKHALGL